MKNIERSLLGKRRGKYTVATFTVCPMFFTVKFTILPSLTYYSGAVRYEVRK